MKHTRILTALLGTLFVASLAQAKEQKFTCMQFTPKAQTGYILEEATIDVSTLKLHIQNLGTGILTEQGDGTANHSIEIESLDLMPSTDENAQAKSAEWKDATAYLLPANGDKTQVLYVKPMASAKDFKARMKITSGNQTKNIIMNCWFI